MAIEGDIKTLLASLVGGRCYPITAPQTVTKPYITYRVISNTPLVTTDDTTGTERRRIQIDIFDVGYDAVKALEASVKATMAASALSNVPLMFADDYEQETRLYRSIMEYSIWSN